MRPRRYPAPAIGNSAADRAGAVWRAWVTERPRRGYWSLNNEERQQLTDALGLIVRYRGLHASPMASVTNGVRSMAKTVRGNEQIRPGQRFKRFDRVVNKLLRYPTMRLSQMEDIGGCRLILPTTDEVDAVLHRIRHNWSDNAHVSDYIRTPKSDGYRGIHVIHRRSGRLIEVQLRTERQHVWASQIEAWSPRVGFNLKDGEGPADLKEYFKIASDRLAQLDAGEPLDPVVEEAFDTLREQVLPYFQARA